MRVRRTPLVAAALVAVLGCGLVSGPATAAAAGTSPGDNCTYSTNPPQYPPNPDPYGTRIAGHDRYWEAVCVSYATWADYDPTGQDPDVAHAAVLARGDLFPDALAGAPLATKENGPLLLTTSTVLRPEVKAELQRILAPGATVYLLGGTGSLSTGVESAVAALGFQPLRIGGANRYEVAVNVATTIDPAGNLYFADGTAFPDGLAAGAAAAIHTRQDFEAAAVVFTNGPAMPPSTFSYAQTVHSQHWYTVGGGADQAIASTFGWDTLTDSYVGHDRYETAVKVADGTVLDASHHMVGNGVGLVDGTNFPDALTGSVLLSGGISPLLLTKPTTLDPHTRAFLQAHAGDQEKQSVTVIGGLASVNDSVATAAVAALKP